MKDGKIKEKIESISKEAINITHFHRDTAHLYAAGILAASIDEHTKALNRMAAIMERTHGFGNMTEKE